MVETDSQSKDGFMFQEVYEELREAAIEAVKNVAQQLTSESMLKGEFAANERLD